MLRCASVYTCEVDDPNVALTEIKSQLDKKIKLLEHSVGVIMCHSEFIATGVLRHICENLPFDLAGVTTSSQAVNDEVGELMLTIFVMTSDDVRFRAGVTEKLGGDVDSQVKAAYDKASSGETEMPKLVLAFPPFGLHAGDVYVRAWGKVTPDKPVFGTHAIDDTASFSECETIYNGGSHKAAMAFVLCYGNINPRFLVVTFTQNNAVSSKASVTKAAGNCVFEINNDVALKYFEDRGFVESVKFTPFMIDFLEREDYDGVPVIRGHAAFTDEGAAVFYGDVDEGAVFTLLTTDADDIVSATRQKVREMNALSGINGALLFSCVVRRVAFLGIDKPLLELQSAKDLIRPEIPFMMGYAGGEICPTSVTGDTVTNRFHNYSLVILVV
ncbi:MAG: FIST C-terminal domain-containing protein [Clostridiales bacterium]|nr:FIST C-terminal domain-containing protein [Clostridiales bacterium]